MLFNVDGMGLIIHLDIKNQLNTSFWRVTLWLFGYSSYPYPALLPSVCEVDRRGPARIYKGFYWPQENLAQACFFFLLKCLFSFSFVYE